ncbi:MAG TPA: 4-hydroxy-tetrahydrodipicolinate synthase [Candidatus Latescibacteria bacterium]|nr:4-hydroxy-tetrahydrodipicolinate synthase [Candidatus Latescibacterota bacterium]
MFRGCYTALVTPFKEDGSVDYEGIERLMEFQVSQGVSGVLSVGTTGESPTLSWEEHDLVTERVCKAAGGRCTTIAGTGSNSTAEALRATEHAAKVGAQAVLLVDPYYNGPSSLEIRREYIGPIAEGFPEISVIPYVIPGRTGTQLLPEDLAILHREHPNVRAVKEATGDLENMRRTRELCGEDFVILSGDDDKTFPMMTDPAIGAAGVISVASNVAPKAVQLMADLVLEGRVEEAEKVRDALQPLFGIVTVKTQESTQYGHVTCRARNPLAIKTLMRILGIPSGPCRRPLGKMTRKGLEVVLEAARKVWRENAWVLEPVGEFFGVDVGERLHDEGCWEGLYYEAY